MYHSISAIISCSARRRVLRKVLWKPADALAAANECLQSLGLKYLLQTGNVFVVESLNEGFPLQVSPQLTAATSRSTPKFGIMCTYILLCMR